VEYDHRKMLRALSAKYPQDGNRRGLGSKPVCFVCDTGDFFYPMPGMGHAEIIGRMGACEDVDWVVLTKRPENIPGDIEWPDNVWLGVTAENQEMADRRIPLLLATGAKVKFVCVEPMLGPVSPGPLLHGLSWLICGGESGPKRRPFDKTWAKALYRECRDASVPMYFKQGSALRPGEDDRIEGYEIKEWPR
jgi:protein gp37